MSKIVYMPLEPYPERYTVQLSRAEDGWLERNWRRYGVPYLRIDSEQVSTGVREGSQVLDAIGRPLWSLMQMRNLLKAIDRGDVVEGDKVYFDDFWHPGFSALPYALAQLNIKLDIYGMIHAQSVDKHDFTYPMRHWMHYFEKGIAEVYKGIFVTSTGLKDLLVDKNGTDPNKIHICGLPYNSEEVKEHFPKYMPERKRQVVWSSRWDKEKDPEFFLNVIQYIHGFEEEKYGRTRTKFLITTGQDKLKSNSPHLLDLMVRVCGGKEKEEFEIRYCKNKTDYYTNLLESAIQFNCADQDWVSWTLLEAATCGCVPVYPDYLSFPECITNEYLYEKGNVQEAAHLIMSTLDDLEDTQTLNTPEAFHCVDYIYKPYDLSWWRMYQVMFHGEEFLTKEW